MALPPGFGVNIVCFRGDYPFAKGCCASVRAHLGDVPIDLYIDGHFHTGDLERTYGVRAVRRGDIRDAELRARSFGYGLTKLVVFWQSRFERFLYLDADMVLWGNVLDGIDLAQADFIHNVPHEPYTERILKSQYIDYDRLFSHTRPFAWEGRHFFNTGVFVARRGLFDLAEYRSLLDIRDGDPSLLGAGDQGMLNVLVFRGADEGRFTVAEAPLQTVLPVVPVEDQRRRFVVSATGPVISAADRTMLHWAGAGKPYVMRRDVYRAPMTWYRRQFLRDSGRSPSLVTLVREDVRAERRQALPVGVRTAIRVLRHRLSFAR